MSKRSRRGFDPRGISTSSAHFLSISAENDKRGMNPLGSTESPFVRRCAESARLLLRQLFTCQDSKRQQRDVRSAGRPRHVATMIGCDERGPLGSNRERLIAGRNHSRQINAERRIYLHRALHRRPSTYRITTIMRMVTIMPCDR